MTTVNTGIKNEQTVADILSRFLASTYTLYLKTQNFHWNVKGKHFYSLHGMFESQYEELAEAVDTVAERIRSVGHRAPASFVEFQKLSEIKEATMQLTADEMISQLLADHQFMARFAHEVIAIAEKEEDIATADMITERLDSHEKTAWMLRATVE
jgi:starvation-inducible DNA-binding protein